MSLFAIAVIGVAMGCASQPGANREPNAKNVTTEDAIRDFDFKLSNTIIDKDLADGKNSFLSPFTIHSALAMAANGAGAKTADNMMGAMGLPAHFLGELNQMYTERVTQMTKDAEEYSKMKGSAPFAAIFANSAWYKGDIVVEKAFMSTLNKNYQATFAEIEGNPKAGADAINAWATKSTNDLVKKIIDPDVIADPEFKMLLASATYVKGSWTKEFRVNDEPMQFNTIGTKAKSVKVPSMTRIDRSRYYETDDYIAVDLNTAGNIASMTIVMPKQADKMTEFKAQKNVVFSSVFWEELDKNMASQQLQLTMPKFNIEYKNKLNDHLKSVGMTAPFDRAKADFSGITRSLPLYISYVQHDSKLKVDEKGFEGAAVVSIGLAARSAARPEEPKIVNIDRPFFFVIRENKSKTLLFLGTLLNPK